MPPDAGRRLQVMLNVAPVVMYGLDMSRGMACGAEGGETVAGSQGRSAKSVVPLVPVRMVEVGLVEGLEIGISNCHGVRGKIQRGDKYTL
jgi:hypothetical protein